MICSEAQLGLDTIHPFPRSIKSEILIITCKKTFSSVQIGYDFISNTSEVVVAHLCPNWLKRISANVIVLMDRPLGNHFVNMNLHSANWKLIYIANSLNLDHLVLQVKAGHNISWIIAIYFVHWKCFVLYKDSRDLFIFPHIRARQFKCFQCCLCC